MSGGGQVFDLSTITGAEKCFLGHGGRIADYLAEIPCYLAIKLSVSDRLLFPFVPISGPFRFLAIHPVLVFYGPNSVLERQILFILPSWAMIFSTLCSPSAVPSGKVRLRYVSCLNPTARYSDIKETLTVAYLNRLSAVEKGEVPPEMARSLFPPGIIEVICC